MTVAICVICCEKVRTPLNSPCVGAKLYSSAGMASASEPISFSTWRTWPSKTLLMLGGCVSAAKSVAEAAATVARRTKRVMKIIIRIAHGQAASLGRAQQFAGAYFFRPLDFGFAVAGLEAAFGAFVADALVFSLAAAPLAPPFEDVVPFETLLVLRSSVKLSPVPVLPELGSTVTNSPVMAAGDTVMRRNPKVASL